MTKAEVYETLIRIQKQHGQGLSAIVKVIGANAHYFETYLQELIEEGLVEYWEGKNNSMGHPESDNWYMPTKGYNVWRDGQLTRGSDGAYLTHVRLYLGQVEDHEKEENRDNLSKYLNPTAEILMKDPHFMTSYSEWLARNHEQLEIMTSLDEHYPGSTLSFSDEEIDTVTSKKWFTDDETIETCLKQSKEAMQVDINLIANRNKLIKLYQKKGSSEKEIKEQEELINKSKEEIEFRKKLHRWFSSQDSSKKIKSLFPKKAKTKA